MDDTARLVSELHDKLADLDGKVAAYQRDLLAQFHRHMDECLKKYPDHVSIEVARVIAESVSSGRYPALSPPSPAAISSNNAWTGRKSPPPVLPHTSGTPKEDPARSPHAREKEFQGLFTPTYLPLLENNDRAYRSPPMSPPPTVVNGPFLALSTDNVARVEGAEEEKQPAAAQEPVSVLRHERSPDPARRLTDWSTSSVESSGSDSKVRRSALRRSSSSTKGSSPRRVRFEFEGEEVFPRASSPQATATISIVSAATTTTTTTTATLAPESGEALALEAEAETEAEPPVMVTEEEDESVAYTTTSLLDVDGEEDFLPRPKKVSSTQALQALTRMPLDKGTVWTRVNPNLEEPIKMNGGKPAEDAATNLAAGSQTTVPAAPMAMPIRTNGRIGAHVEQQQPSRDEEDEDDNNDDDASEEECLSMKPKRKTPSPAATSSFSRPPPPPTNGPATTTATDEDADPFFDLDDVPASHPTTSKYLPAGGDGDSDTDDDGLPTPSLRLRTLAAAAAASDTQNLPPTSPSSVLFAHSIGSYMGRSMTVAPIKDAKLYDEIAGMKDVHFFVGSIDGRTGQEAGDLGSFRASSLMREGNLTGMVPRSFTERLALEEEMERRGRAAGVGMGDEDDVDDM